MVDVLDKLDELAYRHKRKDSVLVLYNTNEFSLSTHQKWWVGYLIKKKEVEGG